MTFAPHRRFTVLAALALIAGAASAADAPASSPAPARTYAVVSLIGDQFSVVSRRPDVGTRVDPNERVAFPIPDAVFDRIAANAVEKGLNDVRPATPVLQALIRDSRLFALQDKLLGESEESHDMRIALRDLLVKAGATHLILVTKRRGEARFTTVNGTIGGGGSISGLGFYLDNETRMGNVDSKREGVGFLAPFSYLMVTLLDLPTMQVIRSKPSLESLMWLPVEKEGADRAWDALTAKEKVDALELLIRRAVGNSVTGMLAD
jgi:hypothetical protein